MVSTGFLSLRPLAEAIDWVDSQASVLGPEKVSSKYVLGRVLSEPVVSSTDWPDRDSAAIDGYAIRAADTEGAEIYAPLRFSLLDAVRGETLPRSGAVLLTAGLLTPPGADTILPLPGMVPSGNRGLDVVAPIEPGRGVQRRGSELRAGMTILPAGRQLGPEDLALLLALGVPSVQVIQQPQVHLVVPGPKRGGCDALTPMLLAFATRDGATGKIVSSPGTGEEALASAVAEAAHGADLVIFAGRSGIGPDDTAHRAVVNAGGVLDLHGIALRPGSSTGLGRIGTSLVALLPGELLACLTSYDILASRAIRRYAGLPPSAYPAKPVSLQRKLVSAIGFSDVVRVRLSQGRAVPLGTAESGGLFDAVQAQGFVLVPERSEGFPAGSTVQVHLRRADPDPEEPIKL